MENMKITALEARKALAEFKVEMSSELSFSNKSDNVFSSIMDVYKNRASYEEHNPVENK